MRITNVDTGLAVVTLDNGQRVPVTDLFDVCGEEIRKPFDHGDFLLAANLVCGPLSNGEWVAFEFSLDDFVRRPAN